jgi:hypothetical protein
MQNGFATRQNGYPPTRPTPPQHRDVVRHTQSQFSAQAYLHTTHSLALVPERELLHGRLMVRLGQDNGAESGGLALL